MIESIGPILTGIKDAIVNPTLYFVLMFVSALLLFLPKGVLKWVKLDELSEKYGPWIGMVFVFAAVIAFVKTNAWLIRKIQRRLKANAVTKKMNDQLWKLYPAERKIIIKMYQSPDRTIWLHHSSSSATILLNLKMVQLGTPIFNKCFDNPYYLQPWVCEYLDEHPEYLEEQFEGKRNDRN